VGRHDPLLVFTTAFDVSARIEAGVASVRADRPATGPLRRAAAVGRGRVFGAGLCGRSVAGVHPDQLHGARPEDLGPSVALRPWRGRDTVSVSVSCALPVCPISCQPV
jgi:hypothetical protein